MWKVYRRTDRQTDGQTDGQTTDDRWSEKLTWAFSSGELKSAGLLIFHTSISNDMTIRPCNLLTYFLKTCASPPIKFNIRICGQKSHKLSKLGSSVPRSTHKQKCVAVHQKVTHISLWGCKINSRFDWGNPADLDRNHACLYTKLGWLDSKANSTSNSAQRTPHKVSNCKLWLFSV